MGRDRDRTIENLLGDALKRHAASASSDACLDAETAAAWTDGALSGAERSRVERHAASCARCQALVAALVRTSPAPVRSSWFRLPRVAWLAPLTAAAAALLVWAIVPAPAEKSAVPARATSLSAPSAAAALDRPAAEPPAPAVPALTAPLSAANKPLPQAKQREKAFADRRQDTDALALAKKQDAKVADAAKLKDEFDRQAGNQAHAAQLQAPPASAAAPPAATPPAAAPSEPKRDAGRAGAVAGAVAAAPAPAAADVAARKSLAESVAQNAMRSRLEASQLPTIIATPNSGDRWRIINPPPPRAVSIVEHSTDGGTTWMTQQQIGSQTAVVAGASPSPGVCWLVGRQGTVMLTTTSGAAWQRLTFPETVDLVAVRATDEANATVTAIDGRAFATTDRGVTWKSVVKP